MYVKRNNTYTVYVKEGSVARASAAAAAQTARDVLEAASQLFAERGYAHVSLDDVAQAAGVTRGAVYHHYGNKAGLFSSLAAQLQARIAEVVVAAAEGVGEDPREQLRVGCHAFLDAITAQPAARVLLIDAPAMFDWDQWRRLDAENSMVQLHHVLEELELSPDLVEAMTVQLSGAMNEAALWIAQQPQQKAARQAAHRSLDRLLGAVTA